MTNHKEKLKFRVGEKIVELGQVQRIFKIEKLKDEKGISQVTLHYKPFYQSEKNDSLEFSLPRKSFREANLRRPSSKNQINEALKSLGHKPKEIIRLSIAEAKELLTVNTPLSVSRVLRLLWIEKQSAETSLSTRKRILYEETLKRFTGEVSVVLKIGIIEAKKKIIDRLDKMYPQEKKTS